MNRALAALVVAIMALLAAFCAKAQSGKSQQDIEPDASPGDKALLVYAGPKVPVTVVYSKSGSDEKIELKAEDLVVETEEYSSTKQVFALKSAAGESFDPPVPLMKFPFRLGDKYSWKGTLDFSGKRDASGEITTSEGKVSEGDHDTPAVLCTAKIAIDGGGDKPAVRELKFWIVVHRGVLAREIGQGVRRQPS